MLKYFKVLWCKIQVVLNERGIFERVTNPSLRFWIVFTSLIPFFQSWRHHNRKALYLKLPRGTLLLPSVSWMMSYRKVTVRHFCYMALKLILKVLRLSLTSWWREGFVWNTYEELKCISSGKTDNLLLHNVIFSEKTHIANPCRISRVKLMSPVFKHPFFHWRTVQCMPYRSLLIWSNWQ